MAGRSPARFLAPIALVAFAIVLYSVVQNAREPAGGTIAAPAGSTPSKSDSKQSSSKRSTRKKRKAYTVKSGDTPSGIAEKTGVTLDRLKQLNPDLDPQTLTPGQRIRLSR